ncbi:centromere protein Q [Synchiropus splendidus]|uniref:centromere protein Q n=1 Tax=Synchiropus splendidus TaxID=270530 RepID=UPI00237D9215|nr:centromere protein Q [Synchiropus splendidus]
MKPVRGSSRDSSEAPKRTSKSEKTTQKKTVENKDPKHNEDNEGQVGPKNKGEESARVPNHKPENLQPISCSSIIALETIMDWSILATLPLRRTEKKETQDHLNILKKSFLNHCAELKAPAHKRKKWDCSPQLHQEESNRSVNRKKNLSSLENGLLSVVKTLESIVEESESIKHACSVLRDRVEEEEEKAKEILQMKDHTVLNLLSVPTQHDYRGKNGETGS